jgi:hypothetical protein
MASFVDDSSPELKTCPYNGNHKVKSSRFQAHITKCAKNSTTKLKTCPFNDDHRIAPQEYDNHLINCSDNLSTFRQIIETKSFPKEQKVDNSKNYNWNKDDIWSDDYFTKDEQSFLANQVLVRDQMTAQELYQMNFGSNESDKSFTDSWYLARMSNEERKKYNDMLCDRQKQLITKKQTISNSHDFDIDFEPIPQINSDPNKQTIVDSNNNNNSNNNNSNDGTDGLNVFRVPNSNPFTRIHSTTSRGIGRGFVPQSHRN